uniref:Ketoreductase (KR) domain-containing protein n=1 Tax=Bionectria ochroleuca TaxID=29856 RepID=A0A0B7KNG6_BIOOC
MDRSELTSRLLPEMTLGSAQAKLNRPLPLPTNLSPAERAAARFRISGTAVVTGGTGDLGSVACEALLEHGLDTLLIWDLQGPASMGKIETLKSKFPLARILFFEVDVTDDVQVTRVSQEALERFGGIDILLTFAGVVSCDHAKDMPAKEWRRTFDINTTGSFLCAKAAANIMVKTGSGGSIVHVASISAHRSLAAEWAVHGIRVNSISPGYMDTILNEGDGLQAARSIWNERNPNGRMGSPEELCGTVILLASSAGRYITGADIIIDGGQTLF